MLLLVGLLALGAASACQLLTPGAPAATPSAAGSGSPLPAAGTPTPAASTPLAAAGTATSPAPTQPALVSVTDQGRVSVSVPGEVAFGPGSFDLLDRAAGLAALSGYTATLKLSFTGTQAGQAQQWSTTYVMLSAQQPAARQLTIAKTGDQPDPAPVFLAELAGTAYERHGTSACTTAVIEPEHSLGQEMEPARFLTAVIGADKAGSDTVNGVPVDHYTFDERALGQAGLATTTGELWVASAGGYLVKYVLSTKGDANYFGDGIEGTLSLDYELTGANQPVAIALPADCPPGLIDAPQLPDAANLQSLPGLLTYTTATSLADAAAFYKQQLPPLGWAADGDLATTDTTLSQDFTRADQTLTVIVSAGTGGTRVDLMLSSAQP